MFHCYVTYVSFQGGIAGFFFGPNPIQTIPFAREHQTSNINPRLQSMGPGLVINGVMGHLTYKYQWPKMNGFHRGYFTYFIRAHLVGSRDPNGRHYHNYILQQNMRDPARKPNLQHQIWVNIHTFIIYISTYYLYVNIYIYIYIDRVLKSWDTFFRYKSSTTEIGIPQDRLVPRITGSDHSTVTHFVWCDLQLLLCWYSQVLRDGNHQLYLVHIPVITLLRKIDDGTIS